MAYNLQADARTGVSMNITRDYDGQPRVDGAFDGQKLFGRFSGRLHDGFALPEGSGYALTFSCEFEVGGDDGSLFPAGTKTGMELSIALKDEGGEAVYTVAPLLPWVTFSQYGTISYSVAARARPVESFFAGRDL